MRWKQSSEYDLWDFKIRLLRWDFEDKKVSLLIRHVRKLNFFLR